MDSASRDSGGKKRVVFLQRLRNSRFTAAVQLFTKSTEATATIFSEILFREIPQRKST
jgi:hypothetical protein